MFDEETQTIEDITAGDTPPADDSAEQGQATDNPPAPEGDEPPPPAPTPDISAVMAELNAMKAEIAESKQRLADRDAIIAAIRESRETPTTTEPEPEIDYATAIDNDFDDKTAAALKRALAAIEQRVERRYAKREEVAQYAQTTNQMAASTAETAAQAAIKATYKASDADVAEVQKRIWDWAKANPGRQNPEWTSPQAAYKTVYLELAHERSLKAGDATDAKKKAVVARQQNQGIPTSTAAPTGNGKIKLDVNALRKKLGRRPTPEELDAANAD